MIELFEFVQLVGRLRDKQKEFFAARLPPSKSRILAEAKDLEAEVDRTVEEIRAANRPPPEYDPPPPIREVCQRCHRPLAVVEDFRSGKLDGLCPVQYAPRCPDAKLDCFNHIPVEELL